MNERLHERVASTLNISESCNKTSNLISHDQVDPRCSVIGRIYLQEFAVTDEVSSLNGSNVHQRLSVIAFGDIAWSWF